MSSYLRAIFCDAAEARRAYQQLILRDFSDEDISFKTTLSRIEPTLRDEDFVARGPRQFFTQLLVNQENDGLDEEETSIIFFVQTNELERTAVVLYDCGALDVKAFR